MKLIDYFLYITYRFAHYTLRKEEGDAKWSAFLHTSLYLMFFEVILICLIGLIIDNQVSRIFISMGFPAIIAVDILSMLILALRYYNKEISLIEKEYLAQSAKKQKNIRWNIYFIMIVLPIVLFVFYRLYALGHIKWW